MAATTQTPRKGVARKTSTRVKKGAKAASDDAKTQQIMPEVDETDPEIEKSLKAYCAMVADHGELTRELTAEKQRLIQMLKDKKLKRYWSKRLEDGVELKPEGEKLERMKHPDGAKKKKAKKATVSTD